MESTLEVSLGHSPDPRYPRGYNWKLTVSPGDATIVRTGWQSTERSAYRAAGRKLRRIRKGLDIVGVLH